MKIGFNVEISTSNDVDNMNFDEAQEYLCRMTELKNYFDVECNYVIKHIQDLKNNFDLPFDKV